MPRTTTLHAVTAIGIDMEKNTLHLIGLDARGAIVLREKVARGRIALRLANLPPCLIGIEAGMATHYVARELAALGHDVKQGSGHVCKAVSVACPSRSSATSP
jgi:transposase